MISENLWSLRKWADTAADSGKAQLGRQETILTWMGAGCSGKACCLRGDLRMSFGQVADRETSRIVIRMDRDVLHLSYKFRFNGCDWENLDYALEIDWTVCNYGGKRPWFLCPARGCGRRVAILYGERIFACRHCYRLIYECQREAPHYRAMRRGYKLHERLRGFWGIEDGLPTRPRGMHQRTYATLAKK
jgi:hypothetical protein